MFCNGTARTPHKILAGLGTDRPGPSGSDIEAQTSRDELYVKMDSLQRQNNELMTRLMRMEAVYNDDAGSVKFLDDGQSTIYKADTPRSWSGSSLLRGFTANLATSSGRPLSQSTFELDLG